MLPAALTSGDQSREVRTSKNYETRKHRYKLCRINQMVKVQYWKKPASNLKSMQIVYFEQTSTKFIEISVP